MVVINIFLIIFSALNAHLMLTGLFVSCHFYYSQISNNNKPPKYYVQNDFEKYILSSQVQVEVYFASFIFFF